MHYYYGYGYDPTYVLVLIGALLSLAASGYVKATFNKYARVQSASGLTGAMTAQRIANICGLNIGINHVSGSLTDHYDPRSVSVNLSDSVYDRSSVAAIAVAAHECGHAVQDQRNYVPLRIRHAIVPVANIGSYAAWPLILIGFFLNGSTGIFLIKLGIWAFSLAVAFQIVTLPVEFNASRRALAIIRDNGILSGSEFSGAKKVLFAAALTYVASAAASILQLLRLLLILNRRD